MKTDPRLLSVADFDYPLPPERIAAIPLAVRHESKLLCYDQGIISDHHYWQLPSLLPQGSWLVFNETKVIPARLLFEKSTGGVIEIFCLQPDACYGDMNSALQATQTVMMQCLVGGASKWKQGMELKMTNGDTTLTARVADKTADHFLIAFSWTPSELSFGSVLDQLGATPLPPYIKRAASDEDRVQYQTVYARSEGSVAAPTAGLHFTEKVFEGLKEKNIRHDFVALQVGAGTFKPVKADRMQDHDMHSEWIDVSLSFLENWLQHTDKKLVAVGTTSLRTLESLYWLGVKLLRQPDDQEPILYQWECYDLAGASVSLTDAITTLRDWLLAHEKDRLVTQTALLVAPGYSFKAVSGLLTNFHQPRSTLLLLIAALIGDDWNTVYQYALRNDYRFLSFGDGSLLWKKD